MATFHDISSVDSTTCRNSGKLSEPVTNSKLTTATRHLMSLSYHAKEGTIQYARGGVIQILENRRRLHFASL